MSRRVPPKIISSREIKEFVSRPFPERGLNNKSSNEFPVFSVIIPSFNQGVFLERTLLSIINQGYPYVEIIIIDGGSTDDTVSIINKYEKYIAYWVSEKDEGQSHALNKGFAKAGGDIFAWQNCDDIYLPNAFQQVAEVFMLHHEKTVCYGNWYSIDENDNVTGVHLSLKPRIPRSPYENMDAYNQAMFWKKEAHQRFGEFDENLHQRMDCDLIVRLLLNEGPAKFYQFNSFLGAFRCYADQKTFASVNSKNFFSEEAYMEKKFNFESSGSIRGKYFRMRFRLAQLYESLTTGGLNYTWEKFRRTYSQRGKFF